MLSRIRLAWVLCAAAPGLLAACGFDSGHDYSVVVTWLINGAAPSPELCEEQGVARVRFTVRSPSKRRTLDAPCSSQVVLGSDGLPYGGFITTDAFDYAVSYDYTVQMYDPSGEPIAGLGYTDTFTTYYGDAVPLELSPLELWDPGRSPIASVVGSWTLAGVRPNAALCAQLGAGDVAIEVASSTDGDFVDYYEAGFADCAEGVLDSVAPALAEGEYVARYVLFAPDDTRLQEIPLTDGEQLIPFIVDQAGELSFDPVDFDLSLGIP